MKNGSASSFSDAWDQHGAHAEITDADDGRHAWESAAAIETMTAEIESLRRELAIAQEVGRAAMAALRSSIARAGLDAQERAQMVAELEAEIGRLREALAERGA